MPKRRPIFEFKGLSGLLGSSFSDSSYYYRSSYTDESPRHPSISVSSRYRSPPRHRRRSRKHKHRHKHRKRHYSRRAHHAADQRHRRHRYEHKRDDLAYRAKAHARSLTEDDMRNEILNDPDLRDPRTRFRDEEELDDHLARRDIRSPLSDSSRARSPRSDVLRTPGSGSHRSRRNREARHLGSPPPFDPLTRAQYQSPAPGYPNRGQLGPNYDGIAYQRSPQPPGYPDDYNPIDRAVDPRLEYSFSRTGLPEEDEGEGTSARSHPRRHPSDQARGHEGHGRRRRRKHKSGSRHRKRKRRHRAKISRKNRESNADEKRDDGGRGAATDSEDAQYDQDGNLIETAPSEKHTKSDNKSSRGKGSEEDEEDRHGKKKSIAKAAALALGALAVGLVAKKVITKRKKKKEEEEAEVAAAQQEAEGPFGGEGGQLFSGSNPLQLPVPKASFSVKVPENEAFIVERGGKYNRRLNPGSNILVPFVDRVAFRFSLKELSMAVPVQQCYTRENISVMASGLLFAKVEDAVAVAYGVDDAHRSLMLLAQTCMRKEIARLGLEQMLQNRDGLGEQILGNMNRASRPWGIRCTRFELRDLDVPEEIRMDLGRQAQMERQVRTDVLASQGAREAMMNRADGEMHAQMRMSQARQIEAVNQAIGEAHAISERGEAVAGAMRDVAEVLNEPGGEKAMEMRIAEQYIHAYAKVAKNQDQLPPPPNPADMAAVMSDAMGLIKKLGQPGSTATNPYVGPEKNSGGDPPAGQQHPASFSQSGADDRPPPTVSHFSGPSPGASSHHMSQSHHGTPPSHPETPPMAADTQSLPHNASNFPQNVVPSPQRSANVSYGASQMHTPSHSHLQHPQSHYDGPSYPQASPVAKK